MPHYSDGTEAKVGDLVHGKDHSGADAIGYVLTIQPGAQTCNMKIAAFGPSVGALPFGQHLVFSDGEGCTQTFFARVEYRTCSQFALLRRKEDAALSASA